MQNLSDKDMECVAGGWDWEFNLGVIKVNGTDVEAIAVYNWAVSETSDFFTWWDPMGYYDRC